MAGKTVRDLIRGPDGYKMLQYMTTSAGGRQMGKQLSNAPVRQVQRADRADLHGRGPAASTRESRAAALKPRKKSAG